METQRQRGGGAETSGCNQRLRVKLKHRECYHIKKENGKPHCCATDKRVLTSTGGRPSKANKYNRRTESHGRHGAQDADRTCFASGIDERREAHACSGFET